MQHHDLMAKSQDFGVTLVTGHQQQAKTSDQQPEQVARTEDTARTIPTITAVTCNDAFSTPSGPDGVGAYESSVWRFVFGASAAGSRV